MADAQPQPPEIGAAELRLDILQAVVAGMAAAALELDLARQQVELVVDDEHLVGRDLEEACQRATDLPDRFMKVIGCSSQSGPSGRLTRATSPK